jgi:hypothetical protein
MVDPTSFAAPKQGEKVFSPQEGDYCLIAAIVY